MFSFFSNDPVNKNFKKNLNKLEYIVLSSMRQNAYKKNYNAGAVILIRKLMPRVTRGNIKGAQKENFRRVYNKYGSIVNESATSRWAQKIANDPYLMKRFFNRKPSNRSAPNRSRFNRPAPVPIRPRFNRPAPLPNRGRFVPHQSKCLFKKLSVTGKPVFKCI
jgi:hypothetical protein